MQNPNKMIFLLFLVLGSTHGVKKLPDGLLLCHRSDPKFSDCLSRSITQALQIFANGYTPLEIPILEPFVVNKLEINESPTPSVAVVQKYRNLYIHGITRSSITNLRVDLDNECSWTMNLYSPQINLIGDVDLRGNIFLYPLNSHGRCNTSLTNLRHVHTMQCEKYFKDGNAHVRFTKYSIDLHPESIHFDFTDLFPSNRQIEQIVLKTMNDYSSMLFGYVRKGFEKAFSTYHLKLANSLFSKLPMDEVFLPEL